MRRRVRRLLLAVVIVIGFPGAAIASPTPSADATPASTAAPAPAPQPCATADLVLREADAAATPAAETRYALVNRGSAACRISGGVGIRLFDARDNLIPLRAAPRTAMPLLLTLAPGEEASFTVSFAPGAQADCKTATRIDVYVAPQTTPVRATTNVSACSGATVRVSNLRLAVPSPRPADFS